MFRIFITFLFIVIFLASGKGQDGIQLVKNNKSSYTIVISPQATPIEKQSARVLQNYIFKASSCSIPIVNNYRLSSSYQIVIGNSENLTKTDKAGLNEDGILIKQVNNTLLLTGGNRKGVLYAAYTFLEEYLGCCAYSAGNVYVPVISSIQLPAHLYKKELPSFNYRMMHFPDAFDSTYCDWRKINYVFEDWGLWVHTFIGLVPPWRFYKDHPEYFALINGKRDTAQLCPSHPDVPNIIIEHLKAVTKVKPWAKYWSVSQNDNQEYCKCDLCNRINKEQESPTGALLNLVNNVAAYFPDKIISTLAYGYSEKPPKTIKPASNVMIMLTTATVNDRRLPLTEDRSLAFHNDFKKWAAITKQLMVWDYLVKYAKLLLPLPNLEIYQPDLRYFASYGTKYLFMQGSGNIIGEFSELKGYLITKLMWNKDVDMKEEKKKFLKGFYGPIGWKYIDNYIDILTKEATGFKSPMLILQQFDSSIFTTYMSRSNIARYKEVFDKALSKVDHNSVYGKRLLKEYSALLYGELEFDMWEMSKGKKLSLDKKNLYEQRVENWKEKVKQSPLKLLSASAISVEDFYKEYKRAVKLLSGNN